MSDPAAADHVLCGSYSLSKVVGLVIATEGATRGYQSLGVHTVQQFAEDAVAGGGASLLRQIRAAERQQKRRLVDHAIKVHDDATLVALVLLVVGRPDKLSGGFMMAGIGGLMLLSYALYRRGRTHPRQRARGRGQR